MSARTAPIPYRPSIQKEELMTLILKKLRYKAVNRFIDEAVREKINREINVTSDPEMDRLIRKLTEVIHEHKGWKFMRPSKAVLARIDQKADPIASGKVKGVKWKGSFNKP